MLDQKGFVIPDWPAPDNVRALVSTRISFYRSDEASKILNGYDHFNLALHVNDQPQRVLRNRETLAQYLDVSPSSIAWLEQIHGTDVIKTEDYLNERVAKPIRADASISSTKRQVCAIMTADCLPVLFCNIPNKDEPQQVAAAHAGWRGLADGILSKTLDKFPHPENVIAWFGPAISQTYFEVGQEVYDVFVNKNTANKKAFITSLNSSLENPKWLASLTELAKIELAEAGIKEVYCGDYCSFERSDLFYSYRRDGSQSGRMVSLIMLT